MYNSFVRLNTGQSNSLTNCISNVAITGASFCSKQTLRGGVVLFMLKQLKRTAICMSSWENTYTENINKSKHYFLCIILLTLSRIFTKSPLFAITLLQQTTAPNFVTGVWRVSWGAQNINVHTRSFISWRRVHASLVKHGCTGTSISSGVPCLT